MKKIDVSELGRLPKTDRNAELQQLSITALRAAFPADKFRFRDERVDDAGVDGSLELIISHSSTNLRAQVQLKSTGTFDPNSDGSVSVRVDASNLNYLLNHHSSIYVLYIEPRNELRFAWAREERKRLDESTPGWLEQGTVTIRFSMPITPEVVEEIYECIYQEGLLQRKFNEVRDKASGGEQLVFSLNRETLDITDPQEAKRLLIKSGTALVSGGYVQQVKDLIRVLDPKDAQEPRMLLIQAHAETHLGRYKQAIALLAEASLHASELSDEDRNFLQVLQDSCDFQTGQINLSEYSRRLERLQGREDNPFTLSTRLHRLRYALQADRKSVNRAALLEELRLLVEEISAATDKSEEFKIHARSCWIESAGHQLVRDGLVEIAETRIKLEVGGGADIAAMLQSQDVRLREWEEATSKLLQDAGKLATYSLIASLMVTIGHIFYGVLTNQKVFSLQYGLPFSLPEKSVQNNIGYAHQAAEIFSGAGNLEGELRAKMLAADFYDLSGQQQNAAEIAEEVLRKARAMGYADLIQRAENQISGQSLQSLVAESIRTRSEQEKVIDSVQESDESVRQNAAQMLRILELPADRLPVMEREYFSFRDVAKEKMNWCRHIDLIQDLGHTLRPETHYKIDPTRFCVCRLHGYRSKFGISDGAILISAFKKTYCEGCNEKNPFNEAS
jgi:hypothetical protein